jgi:hypothetical protein
MAQNDIWTPLQTRSPDYHAIVGGDLWLNNVSLCKGPHDAWTCRTLPESSDIDLDHAYSQASMPHELGGEERLLASSVTAFAYQLLHVSTGALSFVCCVFGNTGHPASGWHQRAKAGTRPVLAGHWVGSTMVPGRNCPVVKTPEKKTKRLTAIGG